MEQAQRAGRRSTTIQFGLALALLLAVIITIAVHSYVAIDRELTQSALSRRASVSYLAAVVLSEKLERLIDIGTALATRVRFRELVEAGKWAEAARILETVPADFPFIDRVTLNDLEGTMVADVPHAPEVLGKKFQDRDWFQSVMRNGNPYISQIHQSAAHPQTHMFVAAIPIRSDQGKMIGIFVVQVRVESFFNWISGVDVGPGGSIYVVDQRGTLAAHSTLPSQGELIDYSQVPVVKQVLEGKKGVEVAFNPSENEERVVAYEPIPKHGWGVVLGQSSSTVFATRSDTLRLVLVAYCLLLVFVICVVYLAFRIVFERGRAQAVIARSEQQQRRQATLLQLILDGMGDGVIVADTNLRVMLMNPVARNIIGLDPAEPPPENWADVQGRYLPDMVTPIPTERLFLSRALRGERVDDEEMFLRNHRFPDGLWISGSARPILSDDGAQQAVVVWRNITERRRAEQEIRALNKDLESFSYSVSHDLRTPLRAIDGFSNILLERHSGKFDAEAARLLAVVRENTRKMGTMIDDILAFSKVGREAISRSEVDMTKLAQNVADELKSAVDIRQIQIDVALLPPTRGNRAILRQVFVNLLANAIKFTAHRDVARIEVGARIEGAETVYYVRDNGAGFDNRYANKLFGVFQRLHGGDVEGTGIGLAIVKRIITKHGGRVWAEGVENEGATFFFALQTMAAVTDKQGATS